MLVSGGELNLLFSLNRDINDARIAKTGIIKITSIPVYSPTKSNKFENVFFRS